MNVIRAQFLPADILVINNAVKAVVSTKDINTRAATPEPDGRFTLGRFSKVTTIPNQKLIQRNFTAVATAGGLSFVICVSMRTPFFNKDKVIFPSIRESAVYAFVKLLLSDIATITDYKHLPHPPQKTSAGVTTPPHAEQYFP